MEISRIPKTPEFIKGVINLRDKAILARTCGCTLEERSYDDCTCIIVINIDEQPVRLIVYHR